MTDMNKHRLGFIGAGKLASSLMRGLLRARFCAATNIIASEPQKAARDTLIRELGVRIAADNIEVARISDIIFVGVKPAIVLPVLREVAADVADKLIISLAAGVRTESMEAISSARLMRVMTNTATTVCEGASGLARGNRTTQEDVETAVEIFGSVGCVIEILEEQIDAVTALSGSGPAFVYTVIEALAEGGEKMGLDANLALTLAMQTVLGAAQLASTSKMSPEELRRMVVSPGGTTAAGLAEMEKFGTAKGLIAAVEAATKRGREMAEENL